MGRDKWSLLSRLRMAIKKVKIILNLDMSRWRAASMIGVASSSRHQLSFNDRPGLRICADIDGDMESEDSGTWMGLQRTISCQSEDDIDKRAEMFIDNFRRQLQIERQISLELRYLQGFPVPINSMVMISSSIFKAWAWLPRHDKENIQQLAEVNFRRGRFMTFISQP